MANIPSRTLSRMVEVKKPEVTIDDVSKIAVALLTSYNDSLRKVSLAEGDLKDAKDESFGSRADVMFGLAKAASDGNWSMELLEAGVGAAMIPYAKLRNLEVKSTNTFKSEIMKGLQPGVRENLGEIFKLAQAAWDAEKNLPDDKRPLFKVYQRAYHVAVRAIMPVLKDGKPMPTQAALVATAVKKIADKPHDPDVAKRAIAAICKRLETLYVEFPHGDIKEMVDFAKGIDAKSLQAAHDAKNAPAPEPEPVPAAKGGRKRNAAPVAADVNAALEDTLTGVQ